MNDTALITGASSGIGRDLARIHAARGGDLVIVARRDDVLRQLQEELEHNHGVRVHRIAIDLTAEGAPERIHDQTRDQGINVQILINNAGFGGHGKFHERKWSQDESMIRLNVIALCQMTHLYLQDMMPQNHGKLLNVASIAAFLPGPLQAVYYATKAFVVSFSQAIAEELSDTKITVTVLCPGAVETDFGSRADVEDVEGFKNPAASMDVATVGYEAMQRGKLIVTNDWKLNFLKNCVIPVLPSRTLAKLSRRTMEKS